MMCLLLHTWCERKSQPLQCSRGYIFKKARIFTVKFGGPLPLPTSLHNIVIMPFTGAVLMFDSTSSLVIDPENSENGTEVCVSLMQGTMLERNVHFSLDPTAQSASK